MTSNRKSFLSSPNGITALWRAKGSPAKRQGILFNRLNIWNTRPSPSSSPTPKLEHQSERLLSLCATPLPLTENGVEENEQGVEVLS
jgi:hypothetical protein